MVKEENLCSIRLFYFALNDATIHRLFPNAFNDISAVEQPLESFKCYLNDMF